MDALGDVLVGRVEERVDAHSGLRHEADGVHDAVELVALADDLGDAVGQRVEVLLILDIQLEQRRLLRQPVGDALNQLHPVESGEHQLGTGLLRNLRDVERDRRVGDDPRDQDAFAFEQSSHIRFFSFVG